VHFWFYRDIKKRGLALTFVELVRIRHIEGESSQRDVKKELRGCLRRGRKRTGEGKRRDEKSEPGMWWRKGIKVLDLQRRSKEGNMEKMC